MEIYISNILKLYESAVIESSIGKYETKAKKEGLPSEKEQLEYLKKEGLWNDEKEKLIQEKLTYLEGIKGAIKKTFIKKAEETKLEEEEKKRRRGVIKAVAGKRRVCRVYC